MKIILASVLALIIAVMAEDPLVHDSYLINKINSMNGVMWKAGENEIFKGKRMSEIKHMLGAFLPIRETDRTSRVEVSANFQAPESFDAYKHWPQCAHPVRDQAQCGSCWAFSASEALTDRFCIAKNDGSFPILSPQDMVSCDHSDYGCRGGYLTNAWKYLENTGIVTDKCMPYKSGSGYVPSCPTKCDDHSESFTKYKAKAGTTKHFTLAAAEESLTTQGPIQAGFMVYQDFFSYKSGVYHHVSGGLAGGHAVLVTGWGVQNGTPYWIVKNSWNTNWGQDGYFWIKKGSNECSIEDQLFAAQADA